MSKTKTFSVARDLQKKALPRWEAWRLCTLRGGTAREEQVQDLQRGERPPEVGTAQVGILAVVHLARWHGS
jgi:hypothetical protein